MLKLLLVVAIVGAVVYLVVRLIERRSGTPVRRRPKPQPRVVGPDDDLDFLRDLDRKRRKPRPKPDPKPDPDPSDPEDPLSP